MKSIALVFPHQLFLDHPAVKAAEIIYILEEPLFFLDAKYGAKMHKAKIILHRASMRYMAETWENNGIDVHYLAWADYPDSTQMLAQIPTGTWHIVGVDDYVLKQRIEQAAGQSESVITWHSSPLFINSETENEDYFQGRKRWLMADFYKHQRRRFNILMEGEKPVGGQWSFDESNRKKVPKKLLSSIPKLSDPKPDKHISEAKKYVQEHFSDHVGTLQLLFPHTHDGATQWLERFFRERFECFGDYEDAIVTNENTLWHSVITPMLNIGLLTPKQVINRAIEYAHQHAIPLNSLEGFIRQIIGWREFMRSAYHHHGVTMRNGNNWKHKQPIPDGFWDGTTGIPPIDDCIQRIVKTGYCHHIERLMVLGGFLFLCEVNPKEIYKWFMIMFVDSYDWVMVTNVYAMSQHSAGGIITTKPYFSGSNYILKMSNHKRGDWCDIWDGLYWRWIEKHSEELKGNPRWAMMVRMAQKNQEKNKAKIEQAEDKFFTNTA